MRIVNETFGQCKNSRRCRQFHVVLGNDLCVSCWDKKTGGNKPVDYDAENFNESETKTA